MATIEARECVAAGVNPATPDRDDQVLCWGDKCRGSWGVNFGGGARCRLAQAADCACYRLKMGWPDEMAAISGAGVGNAFDAQEGLAPTALGPNRRRNLRRASPLSS